MKKLSNTEAEKSVAYKKSVYIGGKYKINRVPEIAQDFKSNHQDEWKGGVMWSISTEIGWTVVGW